MKKGRATSIGTWLAWGAGLMDFVTGVALVSAPAATLAGMGVASPGEEALVFVRFVGAFVGAVGASYLWGAMRRAERLRVVLGATMWLRGAAGMFVGTAVVAGGLERAWWPVMATDLTLVVVQAWLLAKGAGDAG